MKYVDFLSIVLVEPQSPGNVGMVCRAMKNFGLSDLRLVNPCPIDHPEALKFAVSAKGMLASARIFGTLEEAIADCQLSVATTRRHGKYRQEIFSPGEVVARIGAGIPANRAALVFGREDSGLTTDEVALCRWQATIPTDEFGSLNLAQAVLLFCYELHQGLSAAKVADDARQLAPPVEIEPLYAQMQATLLKIGFLKPENPSHLMRSFRRIFSRAGLDSREVAVLRGLFSQVDWATGAFLGKKGK
ncbi:tRNA (cytidine/uridine-2'-O-)-methyltransferase TrmJ [Geobacter sp. OR-1]|uniref:RNA methyltransferase n=1 Tax=Geobacter sp. OR-1 TaxID=1266765 RepID=UPI0005434D99|nr:RNA methyltransferase [Geobacter sp. OR-1]GAM11501.1 tRNA (cytidine/uridine-2'-O-)-methyltransferase TrmJ [Geobacter sp. OR-1]